MFQKEWAGMYNPLIFGKNDLSNIVSCEVHEDMVELFIEKDGVVQTQFIPHKYWMLAPTKIDHHFKPLAGNLFYRYIKYYDSKSDWFRDRKVYKARDIYYVADDKEAAMIHHGFTYFKGMKVNEVSVLAFDLETTGLQHNEDSHVLLIANTLRKNGVVTRHLFAVDDYESEEDMILYWCEWVRENDPSLIIGHNIFGYDIPYLQFCADKLGITLDLGRDGSALKIMNYDSDFRVDGSMTIEYKRCTIVGREIVDTMFVAYHYDFSRKYGSYGLKHIIKEEGLEVAGRQFYDAGLIWKNWDNLEERIKIKQYAEHDGDDALALFDLMIPAYFYLNQSIPKSFQQINYSASGSQINSFLVRSYLQKDHSIPKASEANYFEGAISFGNPGIYQNVFKVDVASLYPSIMLHNRVFDKYKDPQQHFLQMVEYFTTERLENKKQAKETGDRYFKDLSEAQKIIINSAYGMLGATGLHFNSPVNAALVTRKGREILQQAIDWAQSYEFTIVNGDTDSVSFCNADFSAIDEEDRAAILEELNAQYPEQIKWEDDGYYPVVVIVKAKNYILYDGKKVKTKGSALKASMKELALKEFINEVIKLLVFTPEAVKFVDLYHKYVAEIYLLTDISRWSSKKTVSESVMNAERTTELKILAAIGDSDVQMGDKIRVYFDKDKNLKLQENWANDHDPIVLLEKLYKSVVVFENVLNIEMFPNYKLVKNQNLARQLVGLPPIEKVKKTRKKKDDYPQENVSL